MDWMLFVFLVLLGLWIAEKIPGIGMLVRPLVDSLVRLAHVLAQSILEYLCAWPPRGASASRTRGVAAKTSQEMPRIRVHTTRKHQQSCHHLPNSNEGCENTARDVQIPSTGDGFKQFRNPASTQAGRTDV